MTASSTPRATRYRWTICALLFFATTINYIDRQILALIKSTLDEQLHWTNEQYGMTTAFFSGAYAVSLLFFGWFVDRFGTKIGYAVSIVAWSAAAIGHSLVGSVGGFFVARTALGFGEGGNFPSAIKAVAVWFPKRERALSTSIFNAGANVGAIVAPLIVPPIVAVWGWHWAFVLAGLAGLVWLAAWLPLYHLPNRARRANDAERAYIRSDPDDTGSDEGGVSWRGLLRFRQTWSFVVAKGLTDPVWWFFLTWLPDFFKQTRNLEIAHSARYIASIYAIATVLSIFGGWVIGYLVHHGWSITRARKTGMFIFACCVVPIVLVKSVGNWPAVLLIGFACAAHQAWSANLFTTASDMFPRRAVASVVGLGGMVGSGMNILFPIVAGRLLDVFKARNDVTTGYGVLFAACGFAYLVAFALQHLLAPRFEMVDLDRA